MKRKIILASTSPRRIELLSKTGLTFDVCAPEYEEDMTLAMSPQELAKYLSRGKAESIVNKFEDAIIISGDTFIIHEDKVLGKPHTRERAKEMLEMLRGTKHKIISGFTIIDTKNSKTISDIVEIDMYFKDYSDEEIMSYIETGEPLEKAGGYAIQGIGKFLIDKIEGDYDSALGLPVDRILEVLKEFEE